MRFSELVQGYFIHRDNRFRATVLVGGSKTWAHVANSGRLEELFTPGRPVWLMPASDTKRKTSYDLKLVDYEGILVSVDAHLPNPLFAEALAKGMISGFDYPSPEPSSRSKTLALIEAEVTRGNSRLDFRLSGAGEVWWVETKSVTLVNGGTARFPDAPTERGRKHLEELMDIVAQGERAAVVFIVQRCDAERFSANQAADPAFASGLIRAAEAGVSVRAFTCQVSQAEIFISDEIQVVLPG
jgi:sugar fermentation stimulation protein A